MAQIHESVASFLSALTGAVESLIPRATLTWTPRIDEAEPAELVWWSCGLSVDPDCRFAAGARAETWEQLGATEEEHFATVSQAMQQAAQSRFGSQVACVDPGAAEKPPEEWTAVTVSVTIGEVEYPSMEFALNPAFESLFGGGAVQTEPEPENTHPSGVDLLMHVEIPVSVLLGRTSMRMRDLLALSHGSIVELDQELSDEVEIRVSNCTIARGEVVAVDGNYGVRILKMLPGRNGSVAQNALTGAGSAS